MMTPIHSNPASRPPKPTLDAILAPKNKRRVKVWHIALLLFAVALGYFAWYHNRAAPIVSLPAQAASAPAVASSAPEAQAPEQSTSAPAPVEATPAPEASPAAPASLTYRVKQGDWLSRVFPGNWQAVCDLNKINCDRLHPGQVLTLPEGSLPTEKSARADKPAVAKAETPKAAPALSVPKTNDAGEVLYRVVGTAPLNGCGKRDVALISREAWNVLGLSVDDQAFLALNADLKNGPRLNVTVAEGLMKLDAGIRLEQVTFCRAGKVVSTGPMRTAWDADTAVYGERFVLPSGKTLVWMRNCFNWVILPEEKKEPIAPPPPPAEPPVADIPPPLPVAPPAPTPVAEASKGFCERFDPHAVVGQEHEPKHGGGDQADSNFLSAALFCTWRNQADNGTHGLGLSLTASNWSGTVNQRAGKYQGNMHLIGPAYEYLSDDGWDVTVSAPMVGKLHERFSQDQYASQRDFSLIGLSAGYNNYERRLRGETWFPETQVFGTLAKPLSGAVKHSWNGERIADTAELSRFDAYLNLGVRQWLYETDDSWVLPYAQLGYFLEAPSSESLSARLGVSDSRRIAGIGIGVDHDLKRGGDVLAWGWWLDVAKGVQVGRSMYRRHQIITEAEKRGVTVEKAQEGGLIIRSSGSAVPAKQ